VACGCCLFAGCGGGPQIKATSEYRAEALRGRRILLVPLAMSDELGDERTGIVLSVATRVEANKRACKEVAKDLEGYQVVCIDSEKSTRAEKLTELQRRFALEQPIAPTLLKGIASDFGADYALLFRPESVSSTHEVTRDKEFSEADQAASHVASGLLISPAGLLGLGTVHRPRTTTTSDTELSYTISGTLLDMRSAKVLKVGVNSGSEEKSVDRNLGYAEAPPAAPLLAGIIVDLAEALLAE